MRPLRFSVNITLDGCYDHRVGIVDADLHANAVKNLQRADALIFGRVTYELMEYWRQPAPPGTRPDWMEAFANTINPAKKYLVSSTRDPQGDWNTEVLRGDLYERVHQLKQQPGKGLGVGGVKLAMSLTEMGLIDEYEFVVHPRIVGHGPTLFAELSKAFDLKLVNRVEFSSGAVAMQYIPRG